MKPLCVDFVGGKLGYRREHASVGKNSVLAKAIGVRHEPNFVLDATLGFASDTFNFLSMGLSVVGIESSPLVYELVRDGVRRAKEDSELVSWFHHLEILLGRAEDLMNHWEKERPDVIYLDPMFPEKKKSSLSGREMQFLQWLLKDQEMDEGKLLSSARELARERVVVKRPAWAKPIMEDVSHQFAGSSIRYDMYLVKREV